jgi:hypothetical protein
MITLKLEVKMYDIDHLDDAIRDIIERISSGVNEGEVTLRQELPWVSNWELKK